MSAARYGLRVKYHKASSISAFGAPYLQLAWAYSEHEESAADAHERRQVSLILCDVLCDNDVETDKLSCGHVTVHLQTRAHHHQFYHDLVV